MRPSSATPSHSSRSTLAERSLPPQVYQTLSNLQRTLHKARELSSLDISGSSVPAAAAEHDRGGRRRAASTPSEDDDTPPRGRGHDQPSRATARYRRPDYEVESARDVPSARPRSHAADPYGGGPNASRASLDHNISGSAGGFQSTIGQRWGDTMAQMEFELLRSASGATVTTPPPPQDSSHALRRAAPNPAEDPPNSQPPRHPHASNETATLIPQSNSPQHPPFSQVADTMASLELDALRRQSGELAALKLKFKESVATHDETVAKMRLQHQRELEEVTQSFRAAKERLLDEAYQRQLLAFQAKEELYQAEIQTLQLRVKDAETATAAADIKWQASQSDLKAALEQMQHIRREVQQWQSEAERLTSDVAVLRRERTDVHAAMVEHEAELRHAKHREQMLLDEQHRLQTKVAQLDEAMRLQDLNAKEQLRKLEKEFSDTTMQFELLLNESGHRREKYDALKGKWRALKASSTEKEKELEAALSQSHLLCRELQEDLRLCEEAVRNGRAEHARREHELREERASHAAVVQELEGRLTQLEHSTEDALQAKQRELATAERALVKVQQERSELLHRLQQREIDLENKSDKIASLTDEIQKLQDLRSTELQVLTEKHQDEVAMLKRVIAEKDRRFEQLVASSAEPVQKLRRQLEDERAKRATLEQQMESHKKLAREAEEELRRELRREGLRHAHISVTTKTTSGAAPPAGTDAPRGVPEVPSPNVSREIPVAAPEGVTSTSATATVLSEGKSRDSASSTTLGLPPPYPPRSTTANRGSADTAATPPPESIRATASPANGMDRKDHREDDAAAQHEAKLQMFQSASQEVFQRIMNSQQAFWQRCHDVVARNEGAASCSAKRGLGSTTHKAEAAKDHVSSKGPSGSARQHTVIISTSDVKSTEAATAGASRISHRERAVVSSSDSEDLGEGNGNL